MKRVVLLVLLLALTACGGKSGTAACTEIGTREGIGIAVKSDMSNNVTAAKLNVCIGTTCTEDPLELQPGSKTIDEGCNQDEIDGVCSSRQEPDGSLVGFFDSNSLTEENVKVTLTLTRSGTDETYDADVTPAQTFPNGEKCGGAGLQANLELGANGILTSAEDTSPGNS